MTPSRSEPKSPAAETKQSESAQADLLTACEIHTLVQLVYSHVVPPTPAPAPMFSPLGQQASAPWTASMIPDVPNAWPVPDPWLA